MSQVELKEFADKNSHIIVSFFFFIFLLIGLLVYKDYGVHTDEANNQNYGLYSEKVIQNFFFKTSEIATLNDHALTHGPAFELFMLLITRHVLDLTDPRHIVLARHLLVFLSFYIGAVFFYFLCRYHFKNRGIAFLGVLFFILHPKIFPHAFYNSIDIPFLSFYAISIYTLVIFLDKKTWLWAFFHALASALLIDIRLIGLVMPLATACFMIIEILLSKEGSWKYLKSLMFYLSALYVLVILFWPFLWADPVKNLWMSFIETKNTRIPVIIPWDFTFYWILVTTPLFYSVFFLIGLFFTIKKLIFKPITGYYKNRTNLIAIFLFFVPIIVPIILNDKRYNEWRHHYFVYVPFILLALNGIMGLFGFIKSRRPGAFRSIFAGTLSFSVLFALGSTLYFMVTTHPWESSYRNIIYEYSSDEEKSNESVQSESWDYWHLANKKALEYIVNNDRSPIIRVYYKCDQFGGHTNYEWILPAWERNRLVFVENPFIAKYFFNIRPEEVIKNMKGWKFAGPREQHVSLMSTEYYSFGFNNVNVVTVYKVIGQVFLSM